MSKNNKSTQFYSSPEFAPKDLKDHPFYGLKLDPEQEVFRDAIYDPEKLIVLCNSKAGTGKSTIALGVANLLCQYGFYDGIVYVASPTMEQKQGFLPGTIEEKNGPYMEPLIEAMATLGIPEYALESEESMQSKKSGDAYIKFTVNTYLRGCNFENKVVILDEFQNYYFDEGKKTLTRIHDTCKTVVIGHDKQCDLIKHANRSAFTPYLEAFSKIADKDNRVAICELKTNHRGWVSTFCDNVYLDEK